jgi:hypothetical protein
MTAAEVVSGRSRLRRAGRPASSRPNVDLSLTTRPGDRPTLTPISSTQHAAMKLNTESKYPNRRAYVLKLRGDATPGALAGRLENMVTGQQRDFASADELLKCVAGDLESATAEQSTDGTAA